MIHFTSPAGWLPVHWDQLRAQRSVTSMGKLYFYLLAPKPYVLHQLAYKRYIFGMSTSPRNDSCCPKLCCWSCMLVTSTSPEILLPRAVFSGVAKPNAEIWKFLTGVCSRTRFTCCLLFQTRSQRRICVWRARLCWWQKKNKTCRQHLAEPLQRFHQFFVRVCTVVPHRDRWIMRLCTRTILRIIGDLPHNWANPA